MHISRFRRLSLSTSLLSSVVLLSALGAGCRPQGSGAVVPGDVLTYHNDLSRDGQNTGETLLTPANVTASSFGKIGALPVDGQVYAQPLYAKDVPISDNWGRKRNLNLVYVATEHDTVYAFDADAMSSTPVWKRSFLGDWNLACHNCTTLSYDDMQAPNIYPESGITSTPVIDTVSSTIYVVATSKENGTIYDKLHAMDMTTGAELPGSPVIITATLPGTGDGAVNGKITFDPGRQLPRSGLAYANGTLYVAFSSYNDGEPDHGWVFAYDTLTLSQTGAYMSTPNSGDGNIWMAGGAPAIDASGNVYVATGNGDPNLTAAGDFVDKDDSVLKLGFSSSGFGLLDWFMPYNRESLALGDVDLGSGGVLLLPDQPGAHPHMLVAGGKQGTLYLIDRDNMGHFNANGASGEYDNQIVEEIIGLIPGGKNYGPGIYGTSSFWNGHLLISAAGDYLRSIPMVNGLFTLTGAQQSNWMVQTRGSTLSISANGQKDAIVWQLDASAYTYKWVTGQPPVPLTDGPSVLIAYDPNNLATPLYRSDAQTTDAAGNAVKFAVPTVAGGKVFVGTDTEISIYGLRSEVLSPWQLRNITRFIEQVATPAPTPADLGIGGKVLKSWGGASEFYQ